jgi:hypothetical protein
VACLFGWRRPDQRKGFCLTFRGLWQIQALINIDGLIFELDTNCLWSLILLHDQLKQILRGEKVQTFPLFAVTFLLSNNAPGSVTFFWPLGGICQ